jgi:predicted lipoprotein with Yx(FWY)xxD motif
MKREDNGVEQLTYKGYPLYYFIKDKAKKNTFLESKLYKNKNRVITAGLAGGVTVP